MSKDVTINNSNEQVESCMFFFFKQKTAYEITHSDWSSDVCSSDLLRYSRLPAGQMQVKLFGSKRKSSGRKSRAGSSTGSGLCRSAVTKRGSRLRNSVSAR